MSRNANIGSYVFTVRQLDTAVKATEQISDFLQEIFKNEDLYQVTTMSEMLDSLNSMIAMVSAGLGGICGKNRFLILSDADGGIEKRFLLCGYCISARCFCGTLFMGKRNG